jgi:cation-transporting ATPase 13A1
MSALYLDGIKLGDQQLIMSGMTSAVLFMLMSHAKPLDTLAPGDDT